MSASLQQGQHQPSDDCVRRLPADRFERIVKELIERWLPGDDAFTDKLVEVRLTVNGLIVTLSDEHSLTVSKSLNAGEQIVDTRNGKTRIEVALAWPLRGGKRHITLGQMRPRARDRTLIAALRRAHTMVQRERGIPVVTSVSRSPYERRIQRLAFLALDIQRAIIDGVQPPVLNLERLIKCDLPIGWKQQRALLGFDPI